MMKMFMFLVAMLFSGIANAQVYTEIHPPGWMMSTPANPCQSMLAEKAAKQTAIAGFQAAKTMAQTSADSALASAINAYNSAYADPLWAGYYATQNTYYMAQYAWWSSKVIDYQHLIDQANAEIATLNAALTAQGC